LREDNYLPNSIVLGASGSLSTLQAQVILLVLGASGSLSTLRNMFEVQVILLNFVNTLLNEFLQLALFL